MRPAEKPLWPAIEIQDCLDRASAYSAEPHRVARKHDAIGLRPIVAAALVIGALERTDNTLERGSIQHGDIVGHLLLEERIHLGFRPVVGANLSPAVLHRDHVAIV